MVYAAEFPFIRAYVEDNKVLQAMLFLDLENLLSKPAWSSIATKYLSYVTTIHSAVTVLLYQLW